MPHPPRSHPATRRAGRSLESRFCPWRSSSGILHEVADLDARWMTVELEEGMIRLDDESLLRFVLTQIQLGNAVVDICAQHYIKPRCLSIPCRLISLVSDSYAVIQAETSRMVMWWIEQVILGKAWLDRRVLFAPREMVEIVS
ncbi:uncharacterized protein N7515_002811 [Penicillium bovifimosum]|uniref:Uncharacterized protein n=1 Tax=Penicillium bovifimosum TaxID=126998 RepID=A0A9W9HCF9_9EURO|nr:uncharacterized protein N7515_002811 [Penicillium bovifimosum]KAJ5144024.1 hypothetical protein N7515_002811 [Penicillium bovifimosum]